MRTGAAYAMRGEWRRSQGDCKRAVPEYDEALKLEPRNATASRGRDACS
jgi:hypothetical protein